LNRVKNPEFRFWFAVWAAVGCTIAWPVTALTIFRSEPQGILGLSWVAIILTFVDIVINTDIRREQDD
jgi:hypothetical protein